MLLQQTAMLICICRIKLNRREQIRLLNVVSDVQNDLENHET